MRTLLDTTAYSALVRGHRAVAAHVRRSSEVILSSVVVGELFYGFWNGARFDDNVERLEAFLDRPSVSLVPVGRTTAERYGLIASALRRNGQAIPTNDIWIAAHALETGADILSSDRHFGLIGGVSWLRFSTDGEDSVHERIHRYHAAPRPGEASPAPRSTLSRER